MDWLRTDPRGGSGSLSFSRGPRPEGGDSEGEITNKSQIPILNDQNRFGIWNFGHCDLFDIWDL
jgi:hypothetical protein